MGVLVLLQQIPEFYVSTLAQNRSLGAWHVFLNCNDVICDLSVDESNYFKVPEHIVANRM